MRKQKFGGRARCALISFYPHPIEVLVSGVLVPRISTLRQNLALLKELGIEILYLFHFTDRLSKISKEQFVEGLLIKELNIAAMVIGPDAAVGKDREGSSEYIKASFERAGRTLEIVPFVNSGEEKIGSRSIRKALSAGEFEKVNAWLNRSFALEGRVVHGAKRGAKLQFPTANLRVGPQVLPPKGVYATYAILNGARFKAVTNIGMRPTFGGKSLSVETHILDQNLGPLYGKRLEVQFVKKLRDEQSFASSDALHQQIKLDVEGARKILG